MKRTVLSGFVVLTLLHAVPASAALVLDQQQPHFDVELGTMAIGGDVRQRLAQTVTAGVDGGLAEIHLPVECASGALVLEIVELDGSVPSSRVRARVEVPASTFPPTVPPEFRAVALDPPLPMSAGERFAFTLDNPTGECWTTRSVAGDPYGGGEGFFTNIHDDPDWIAMKGRPEPSQDLAFKTFVEVPGGGRGPRGGETRFCSVNGLTLPIPAFVPVCRCLEDASLREQRCTLLHPSLVLFRRIPLPLQPGSPFAIRWTVMPLERIEGTLRIEDVLPPGFHAKSGELLIPMTQLAPGSSLTLTYDAQAGAKPGTFKFDTEVAFGEAEGRMTTAVEVAGK